MIKHICVCDICEAKGQFNIDTQTRPDGWHTVCGFIDNAQDLAHICPSCWKKLQECAEAIHERECCH